MAKGALEKGVQKIAKKIHSVKKCSMYRYRNSGRSGKILQFLQLWVYLAPCMHDFCMGS